MGRESAKLVATVIWSAGALLGVCAWWLVRPNLESYLGQMPGRVGAAAVGLGLWAVLALFIAVGMRATWAVARRLVDPAVGGRIADATR